jgi:hypothetical protein
MPETFMSLIVAFIGIHGTVMAGDMREIITVGERISIETLEHELYEGLILTDEELKRRAEELGVSLTIRDDKRKVTQRDGILVGEVCETEFGITRKRRLYATAGEYAIAEIAGPAVSLTDKGRASNFVVLGNPVTKQIAHTWIREHWKGGGIHDAIRILVLSMERAAKATASVSGVYTLIQTPEKVSLTEVIARDSRSSWGPFSAAFLCQQQGEKITIWCSFLWWKEDFIKKLRRSEYFLKKIKKLKKKRIFQNVF